MSASLADVLTVLWPTLPAPLASREAVARLEAVAQQMAPLPEVGLECRLSADAQQVDLQQCIRRSNGDPVRLVNFLERVQSFHAERSGPWQRLRRFCHEWSLPGSPLHNRIPELFLEYDLDTSASTRVTPSVFFSLQRGPQTKSEALRTTRLALAWLLPEAVPQVLQENLEACFLGCPAGSYCSAVGIMLGRSTRAVRLNIKDLRVDEITPFLRRISWSGPIDTVQEWAQWAFDWMDRLTLCLDVGETLAPRVAFECYLDDQPEQEPRWQAVLEALVSKGLCTSEKAAALLSVPGRLYPPNTKTPWPAPWLAEALLRPKHHLPALAQLLTHLKLTVEHDGRTSVKAYWGAGYVWEDADGMNARARLPVFVRGLRAHDMRWTSGSRSIERAIHVGIEFLSRARGQTGWWRDFRLPPGASDEWVTAFVGAMLAPLPEIGARKLAQGAWKRLSQRRSDDEGWGYNRLTPADADSTAWALTLARALGVSSDPRAVAAQQFLEAHELTGGALTTYLDREAIRRHTRLPESASFGGWQAPHLCVTAAAVPMMQTRTFDALGEYQGPSGQWNSYWWWDDEYTTSLAASALASTQQAPNHERVTRAVTWALSRVSPSGAVLSHGWGESAWASGWTLRLLLLGSGAAVEGAQLTVVDWLLRGQQEDGSWRRSARLRVPMPGAIYESDLGNGFNVIDQNAIFTTAAVVGALAAYREHCSEPDRSLAASELK